MAFERVADISEVEEGKARVINIEGDEVALFNIRGKIFAISNICPHRGGPLAEGEIDGNTIICPWHAWQFNIETGKGVNFPVQVKKYDVKIEGKEIFIDIS